MLQLLKWRMAAWMSDPPRLVPFATAVNQQVDRLSGKPGHVGEFDRGDWSVRDLLGKLL